MAGSGSKARSQLAQVATRGDALIGIVIVANRGIAKEFLNSIEDVFGKQDGVRAITFDGAEDRKSKGREICSAVDAVDSGSGVIVVTDLFGSSPANLCLTACCAENRIMLSGANVPMLISLIRNRRKSIDFASSQAVQAGRKYMVCMNDFG